MQQYKLFQQYNNLDFINENPKEMILTFNTLDEVYQWIEDEIDFIHEECPQCFISYEDYEKDVIFTSWDQYLGSNCIFLPEIKEIGSIDSNYTWTFIPICVSYDLFDHIVLNRWLEIE